MKKIVVIDDSESILYPTKLALERIGDEAQMRLDPSAFYPGIFGVPAHVSEGELPEAARPCGAGGYLSKAWGVEQLIARIPLALGHDKAGAE